MLPETTQAYSSFVDTRPLIQGRFAASSPDDAPGESAIDAPLEDAARAEREYVRQRLREELQREPTEEEVDQWLREHTEGY